VLPAKDVLTGGERDGFHRDGNERLKEVRVFAVGGVASRDEYDTCDEAAVAVGGRLV